MENKPNLAFALIALGCSLILVQYFFNRSLWFDEALLALNIIGRDFAGLLSPLDHYQAAPVLFLLIERFFVKIFGPGELCLRLFPVLCSLASVLLFWRVVQKLSPNKTISLLALSLFCLSPSLIYFASELKQYACDVLVLLLHYYVLLYCFEKKSRFCWLALSVLGVVSIFLSNISVVVLLTTGGLMLVRDFKSAGIHFFKYPSLPVVAVWAAAFAVYYFLFVAGHPLQHHMTAYWQKAFPPQNPFSLEFLKWAAKSAKMVFTQILAFPEGYLLFAPFVLVWLAGLWHLFKSRKFEVLYLLTAPVLLHFALAYFKLYPFDHRFILYQTPLFVIATSIGFYQFYRKIVAQRRRKEVTLFQKVSLLQPWLLTMPAIFFFQLMRDFPTEREEIKSSIEFINKNIEKMDNLYVFYGAAGAFRYYRQIGFATFDNPASYGRHEPHDFNVFEKELEMFRERTWVLFSHLHPFGTEAEEVFIVKHLSGRGKLLKSFKAKGSAAYLFDIQK